MKHRARKGLALTLFPVVEVGHMSHPCDVQHASSKERLWIWEARELTEEGWKLWFYAAGPRAVDPTA